MRGTSDLAGEQMLYCEQRAHTSARRTEHASVNNSGRLLHTLLTCLGECESPFTLQLSPSVAVIGIAHARQTMTMVYI